jgi:hypothetical protein
VEPTGLGVSKLEGAAEHAFSRFETCGDAAELQILTNTKTNCA